MTMYRCREAGIYYDRYKGYIIGRRGTLRRFEYPQMADVYMYCARHYGYPVAESVADNLQGKLETTFKSFAKDSVAQELKDKFKDYLLGRLGKPDLITDGLAWKIIEAAATVLGEATMQTMIDMNKSQRNYTSNFNPDSSEEEYCKWVIYSWVKDPENGPYYSTYLPGSLRH